MTLQRLFEPIPDINAYLKRIHMDLPIRREKEVLDRMIYLHQCHIPFENLDVYLGKKDVPLAVGDVFDKIVRRKRGGFCFEMNNLFYAVLQELGFDAYPCLCKVVEGDGPYYPALHRGTIVRIEDALCYCDVGFGGPIPAGAIRLEENVVQTFAGDSFQMRRRGDGWWEVVRQTSSGKEDVMLRVNPMPYDPVDFVALAHYCCCQEQKDFTHFNGELVVNIRTEHGYAGILDNVMKQKEDGKITETVLKDSHQLLQALYQVFRMPEEIEPLIIS